ncbi:transposase [Streptomyces sp. DT2A-34]|uniref:transposase n=1 Tax=Streptomyces sp. DT2A-34 TaxID=3051182 RepID=UPI00265B9BD1|nr:transposase [Streptomyces sp. DT2A-34]MDO0909432.1 transposase [Streptomyces sp. DT2A-34]
MGFPPRELRDLQLRVRAEQQTLDWKTRYAVRSGVEGTINEFAHGHGMRHCRYRGQPKAHLQHVLTAIAVKHRTPQRSASDRGSLFAETADRFPDLPRPERGPPGHNPGEPSAAEPDHPRSPTESS